SSPGLLLAAWYTKGPHRSSNGSQSQSSSCPRPRVTGPSLVSRVPGSTFSLVVRPESVFGLGSQLAPIGSSVLFGILPLVLSMSLPPLFALDWVQSVEGSVLEVVRVQCKVLGSFCSGSHSPGPSSSFLCPYPGQ
uniref:Uncharacterized protein n=1 Tax=Cannabis sativa TaxID=3483 RepID=A0A803QRI3_CANSA